MEFVLQELVRMNALNKELCKQVRHFQGKAKYWQDCHKNVAKTKREGHAKQKAHYEAELAKREKRIETLEKYVNLAILMMEKMK